MKNIFRSLAAVSLALLSTAAFAQKYVGVVDRSVAVVGNELITLSDIESEVQVLKSQGYSTDRNVRCDVLQSMMESKLFLMQARIDSLNVKSDMVSAELNQRLDQTRSALGGDEATEAYFGKPLFKLRQEWQVQLEEQSLTQQEQQSIAESLPELTPYDVRQFLDSADVDRLPIVPMKYQMSQICVYPDREAAALAVKERLLSLRERIINGEKFSTLARLYSEDGSALRGGELGMASKSIYWPVFSDAAMALKPGNISQIVETPDGFHLIEVIEKKGDMFNARHILMKPKYTAEDQEKAFSRLDSLRTMIMDSTLTFEQAARFFSQDLASRTNGGQMADPSTGSAYFEVDQIKPQDYAAVANLQPGEISEPIASLDNEGREAGRDGNLVYKIVRLDKIVPAHTANFESDYTDILNIVRNRKSMEAIDKFVTDRIKDTYIVIDPMFSDCEFTREGWAEKFRKED